MFARAEKRLDIVREDPTKKHIVADSTVANRAIIVAYLKSFGLHAEGAECGTEVLEKIEQSGINGFDVIWCDQNLPILKGTDLAKLLRERGFERPICIVTGNVTDNLKKDCHESDVDMLCLKPIRKKSLEGMPVMQVYADKM